MTFERALDGQSDRDRMWSIAMGDVRLVVYADSYEQAVVELGEWCRENGVERTGADFLRGRLHEAVSYSEPFIPGEEGLTTEPLSIWRIEMGDLTVRVRATEYEHAVVWLEAWCHDQGIERRGASFVREASAA